MIGTRPSGNIEMLLTFSNHSAGHMAFLIASTYEHENFTPFFTGNTSDFLRTVIMLYWCFTGFEISAIPADETKNKKDVFRSLVIVMLVVTFVYLFLNISLIAVWQPVNCIFPAPMAGSGFYCIYGFRQLNGVYGIIAMMSALNAYLLPLQGASKYCL